MIGNLFLATAFSEDFLVLKQLISRLHCLKGDKSTVRIVMLVFDDGVTKFLMHFFEFDEMFYHRQTTSMFLVFPIDLPLFSEKINHLA
jgi:hypothetical protein